MGVACQRRQISDPVARYTCRKKIAVGQRAQRRKATRRTPLDCERFGVNSSGVSEILGSTYAILGIYDAPLTFELVAVRRPKPRAASIIHIDYSDAAVGPILNARIERRTCCPRWTAVAQHEQWWQTRR